MLGEQELQIFHLLPKGYGVVQGMIPPKWQQPFLLPAK